MRAIYNFIYAPIINKINFLRLFFYRAKTQIFYRIVFSNIGCKSVIYKPLLLIGTNRITIGRNVMIRDGARLETVNSGQIFIGNNVSIEQFFHLTAAGILKISDNVTILFNVMVTDIDHEYQEIDKHILQQPYRVSETRIGENCFIGSGAKIQAGTILGRQCIVGANAVVRGKYPDYCVIVGAPAKVVKRYNTNSKLWEKVKADGSFYDA